MTQDTYSLRLLVEEYPADPAGTVTCLQTVYGYIPTFASRLQHISAQFHSGGSHLAPTNPSLHPVRAKYATYR